MGFFFGGHYPPGYNHSRSPEAEPDEQSQMEADEQTEEEIDDFLHDMEEKDREMYEVNTRGFRKLL